RWLSQPDDPVTPEILAVPSLSTSDTAAMPALAAGSRAASRQSSRDTGASGARRTVTTADGQSHQITSVPTHQPAAASSLVDDLTRRRGRRPGTSTRTTGSRAGQSNHPARRSAAARGTAAPPSPADSMPPELVTPTLHEASVHDSPDESVQVSREPVAGVVDMGRWNPRRSRPASSGKHAGDEGAAGHTGSSGASRGPAQDDALLPPLEPAAVTGAVTGTLTAARGGRKASRKQVPSWDEIVFGARTEPDPVA
ncbi:MAG: hypothetical protein LBB54_06890, partial [Cellulomonadaceae bacterium]|nr:hypothetical protein [Cellulomonadaceae bacterium]